MLHMSQEMMLVVVGGVISWVVVILGVAQLSRFYAMFREAKRNQENALVGLAGQTKRLETLLGELVREQRRGCRLLGEITDLQKAQMTGEYEVVEEPVPQTPPPEAEEPVDVEALTAKRRVHGIKF